MTLLQGARGRVRWHRGGERAARGAHDRGLRRGR